MSFLKKLGLITSNEEPKLTKTKKQDITPSQNINTTITNSSFDSSAYDKILEDSFEKVNLPGPDFREFYKTLKTIENQPLPEQQKYILAFSGFSVMGLTKDKIIETSNIYLNAIEKEKTSFQNEINQYKKIEIEDKTIKSNKLSEENNKLQKQIQENMASISQLNIEVSQNSQNLATKQQAFNNAIEKSRSTITTIINNIKTYL